MVTISLIAATVLVSFAAFQNSFIYDKYLFSVHAILSRHEYYRTITSAFIHADIGHLVFNMFSFYAFAAGLESVYGPYAVAGIYIAGALAGSILSLALHRRETGYRALGASGAVCGIIFSSIFLLPGGSIIVFPLPVPIPAWLYAVIFILASIYGIGRNIGNIGHDAHLGGALAGIISAYFIVPVSVTGRPLLLAAIIVPVVIFFVLKERVGFLRR